MISDVKRAKYTHYFHITDLSNDGIITKGDYMMAAERVIATLGVSDDSMPAQMLRGGYAQYWEALTAADTDGSDSVTLDEWIAHFTKLGNDPTQVEAVVIARGNAILQIFDADRDGKISRSEWAIFFRAVGYSDSEYELAFDKLDLSGDGFLSNEEIRTAGREFFMSDDPDARGNYIYGDYTKYLT